MKEAVVLFKELKSVDFEKPDILSEKMSDGLTLLTLDSFILHDGEFHSSNKRKTGLKSV